MRNYIVISESLDFVKKLTTIIPFKLVVVPYKSKIGFSRLQMIKWKSSFPFHNILFYDFDNYTILDRFINLYRIDSCIIYSMPYLLSSEHIGLFKGNKINIHPSELPKFRGPNPIIHQILANEDIYVTIHEIDSGEDSGDIIASKKLTINNLKSYSNIDNLIISEAIEMLDFLMSSIETAPRIEQDMTIKRVRAKRLTEEQIINLLKTKSFEHEVILKLLIYRPNLMYALIKQTKYSKFYDYKVDPQSTSSSYFVIPSGVIYYRRRISLKRLFKSLVNIAASH